MNRRQALFAVGAGMVSLAVCSGATVVSVRLLIASTDFVVGGHLDPTVAFAGVSASMVVAWSSLTLPVLAFGFKGRRAVVAIVFSGFVFFAFVVSSVLSVISPLFSALGLAAFVAIPAISSLIAIRAEGEVVNHRFRMAAGTGTAIYFASLLTMLVVPGYFAGYVAGLIVAALSWLILPTLAALPYSA